jgi:uncharacterized membrane protein YgcG
MLEKKYYEVSIVNDNWQKIHDEICSQTCNCEHIPDEKIECYDPMYYSPTRSRYLLTEEEAEKLKNHPDVDYVELDVTFYPELRLIATPCGSFVKREFDSTSQQFPKIYRIAGLPNEPQNLPVPPISEDENKRTNWAVKRTEESTNEYFLKSGFDENYTNNDIGNNQTAFRYKKFTNRSNKSRIIQNTDALFEGETRTNLLQGSSNITENHTIKRFKTSKESDIPGIINDATISKYYNSSLNSINYEKSGKNVDVIILDEGILQYHPEFKDRFPTSGSEPFSGKSRARDLLLDGPYFLDPEYFNQNTAYKTAKFDGRPTCTRIGALNWWKSASNRSARFSTIATFPNIETSITRYFEEYVIGGPPAPGQEDSSGNPLSPNLWKQSTMKFHGLGCAGVSCGNNFGSAVDARIWNVTGLIGTTLSYVIFPMSLDLITAFHNAKKLCPDSIVRYSGGDSSNKLNYAPTIVNNSYANPTEDHLANAINSGILMNTKWKDNISQNLNLTQGPMHNYTANFSKSVGGIVGTYTVNVSQNTFDSSGAPLTKITMTGIDNILQSASQNGRSKFNVAQSSNLPVSFVFFAAQTPFQTRSSGPYETTGNELINSGVIFVTAAGNETSNIVSYNNPNYNNYLKYFTYNSSNNTLNEEANFLYSNTRGFPNDLGGVDSSSGNAKTINVGAYQHTAILNVNGSYNEHLCWFTNRGSGIDIFAPGENVLSSSKFLEDNEANTTGRPNNQRFDAPDGKIPEFTSNQADTYGRFSDVSFNGTSCACPVTVGVIALYLEEKPNATYNDVQNWLKNTGSVKADFYNEFSNPNDPKYWESLYSLLDSQDRMLHNPYVNKVYSFKLKNSTIIDAANKTPDEIFNNKGLTKIQAIDLIKSPPTINSSQYATFKLAVDTVDNYLNNPSTQSTTKTVNVNFAGRSNGGNAKQERQRLNGFDYFSAGGGGGGGYYGGGGANSGGGGGGGSGLARESAVVVKATQGGNSGEGYVRIWLNETADGFRATWIQDPLTR